MLIIGIDPGISGSICFLDNGKILDVIEMPIMTDGKKNKKQVNGSQVYNEVTKRIKQFEKNQIRVVIEHVSAMPGQGVTSMFNFGQSFLVLWNGSTEFEHDPAWSAAWATVYRKAKSISGAKNAKPVLRKVAHPSPATPTLKIPSNRQ